MELFLELREMSETTVGVADLKGPPQRTLGGRALEGLALEAEASFDMARPSGYYSTAAEAKSEILKGLRKGMTVEDACREAARHKKTYEYYTRTDPDFREQVRQIRSFQKRTVRPTVPNFTQFSEKYYGMKLYRHQLQWVDLLEGREPRDLHPSQMYEKRSPRRLIINTPPFHAKSMTVTINYVTWRIVENPNIRVIIVSKTETMAKKFLSAVKDRLGGNGRRFQSIRDDFAPRDGYDGNGAVWRQNMVYINPELRDRGEKDPTCEALGIGQQIYGARADLIVLDDCVTLDNAHEFEKQIEWIQNEVFNRLEKTGKLLIIGTRLKAQDLYSEIRKPVWYASGQSPFSYLTQPAVLENAEDPAFWVTLWPRTNVEPMDLGEGIPEPDSDGLYPAWDGPALAEVKEGMSAENWARVYMQAQISESMTFTQAMVDGCTNELRVPGPMVEGRRGHRPEGMAGLYVIGGLDPAPTNYSAAVVLAVERMSGRRYLLDVWNKHSALPSEIRDIVKGLTMRYGIMEWRIEENGLNKYISQDEEIVRWCRSRGVQVNGHMTNQNKWDPQFGVATMANLFYGYDQGVQIIELPSRRSHAGVQSLVEEMLTWYPTPGLKNMPKQDCLMALWFAELRARTISNEWDQTMHLDSPYRTPLDAERQVVLDIDAYLAQQHAGQRYITLDEFMARNPLSPNPGHWR